MFAEFVSEDDYQMLESLHESLEHIAGYAVRSNRAEYGDRPADGIVAEYREDYLSEWPARTKEAMRTVGRRAGYPSDRIREDIRVSAPQPGPRYDALPPDSDMKDLSNRIRELVPGLQD